MKPYGCNYVKLLGIDDFKEFKQNKINESLIKSMESKCEEIKNKGELDIVELKIKDDMSFIERMNTISIYIGLVAVIFAFILNNIGKYWSNVEIYMQFAILTILLLTTLYIIWAVESSTKYYRYLRLYLSIIEKK